MGNIINYTLKKENIKLGDMIYLNSPKQEIYERDINILISPDNNYVKHCAVVMTSVLLNCDSTSQINFFITDDGLTNENKNYLRNLTRIRPFKISFLDVSKYDLSIFPLNREHIKVPTTYHRLLIGEILPQNVEKLLYLDCDVIVEKDLKELFDIDLGNKLIGVVEDESSLSNCARLGLDFYFNAGVALYNIKELRKFDLYNKCLDYFNKNKSIVTLQDQDILNAVLQGKWYKLHLSWNAGSNVFKDDVWTQCTSFHEKIIASVNPGIIHYTSPPKPWEKSCLHILKDEYMKYLQYADIERYNALKESFQKSRLICIEKTNKYSILKLFGLKLKFKRKSRSELRLLHRDVENIQIQLAEMNKKLDKLLTK